MDKNNIKRVKNILLGNYSSKSNVSIGYKKQKKEHKEGDIWEESGKTWTIKNGIKQTITKLDNARKMVRMPLVCPECNNLMKKRLDKKMWKIRNKCFDCVIEEDTERIKKGKFKEYEKEIVIKNMKSYFDHIKDFAEEYIDKSDSKYYITEFGDIENWKSAYTKKQLKKIFNIQIEEFKKKLDNKEKIK